MFGIFRRLVLGVMVLSSFTSEAGNLTGRINTIAPILSGQNQIYVSLITPNNTIPDGTPSGSCSNGWAFADMTDSNFRSFIYPLILMAKAADADITLRTNGCNAGYPVIVGVDYTPR